MRRIHLSLVLLLFAHPTYAYRPFNSTDAAVAARGEMEIECGPIGDPIGALRFEESSTFVEGQK
jgi:hypothetical protein